MNIEERIKAFARLGDYLKNIETDELQSLTAGARNQNPWFTEESVKAALTGIRQFLSEQSLEDWTTRYSFEKNQKKVVALVLAGNIPLVGFHDILAVLISGHKALIKLSSKDQFLTDVLLKKLFEYEPRFAEDVRVADQLKHFDAVIATGSDNTSRYFEYYFGKYPHIIRKNRTSVAILDGNESSDDLRALGRDVFTYYGLGCRNVSKLFIPRNFSFERLFEAWSEYENIIHHHKYCNNYDYQKSILLVNRVPFLDGGFVILQQSEKLVSPISILYYDFYENGLDVVEKISAVQDKVQVVVGNAPISTVRFGQAQCPAIDDYADRIDTLKFLSELN
jgi:hypothetical protein